VYCLVSYRRVLLLHTVGSRLVLGIIYLIMKKAHVPQSLSLLYVYLLNIKKACLVFVSFFWGFIPVVVFFYVDDIFDTTR
jgi:hypothetical protein